MDILVNQKKEAFAYDRRLRSSDFDMANSHYHTHYELFYLLSGQCKIFIDHTLYHVEAGTAVMIRPGEIHRTTYRSYQEMRTDRVAISFSGDYLKELSENCREEDVMRLLEPHRRMVPPARRGYIEELLEKISFEDSQEDEYSSALKKYHLYELLILLNRFEAEEVRPQNIGKEESSIEEAAWYIYHNFNQELTLSEVAGMVHMSPAYFSRRFKKVTGFGYKEYLNNVRLKKAVELLLHTGDSVTQIALKCGFGDGNYFGDVFRKAKGMSPNQYRKNPEVY